MDEALTLIKQLTGEERDYLVQVALGYELTYSWVPQKHFTVTTTLEEMEPNTIYTLCGWEFRVWERDPYEVSINSPDLCIGDAIDPQPQDRICDVLSRYLSDTSDAG